MSIELLKRALISLVTPKLILPLKPMLVFLCRMILIIPLIPSGLYFAEGLVINSICLMDVEGICFNNWATGTLLNLPSTITRTFSLPLKLILPLCWSTFTEGILFIISLAVAPAVVKSFPTFTTLRSIFCSMVETSATTVTSSNPVASSSRTKVPRLMFLVSEVILISLVCVL